MPEWLWIVCGAAVLAPPAAFAQHAILAADNVARKSVESLAGTFQRCAIETRGTARMWEDLNETGLALLHQNLAVVWQNLAEVEQEIDAPAVPKAVVLVDVAPLVASGVLTHNEARQIDVTTFGEPARHLPAEPHGYEYPVGCRCGTCWAEYRRRAAWPS